MLEVVGSSTVTVVVPFFNGQDAKPGEREFCRLPGVGEGYVMT
jgi:hypothetical protein